MSYLDDPRVFFAAERTLLAWQRSALAFIALGFVVERFGLFIRYLDLAHQVQPIHLLISVLAGLTLITLGMVIALLSNVQYGRFIKTLSEQEIPKNYFILMGPIIGYTLFAGGLLMTIWIVAGFLF